MPLAQIGRSVILAAMVVAGLWPHFSTPGSWLAAAIFAGVFYSLGGPSLRSRPAWWALSVGFAIVLWYARAKTHLVVPPAQLLPSVEPARVSLSLLALSVIASLVVVSGLRFLRGLATKWRILGLLLAALIVQIISSIDVGATVRRLSRHEPADRSYNFDGIRYLKAFYLMKRGVDWYEACVESTRVDARGPFEVPRVVMNYRLPTLYALLSFLPDGSWIQILFILLSCFGMWAAFDVVRRLMRADKGNSQERELCALAAALLSSPYFLLGAVTWFYTFHEYWACFAALAAMTLLARGQTVVAVLMGVLSACIREHFLLVLIVISVLACRSGNLRGLATVCAGWFLLVLVYVIHVWHALPYTGQGVSEGTAVWLHWPSLKSVLYATMFGSTLYPWPTATVPLLLLSALWGLWGHRNEWISVGLMGLIATAVLAYLVVGPQIPSGGYWGVVYMPWVFLAAPLGTSE